MVSLRALAREIHENARVHGWHDEPRSFGGIVALCHSELSEALEEYRNRMPMSYTDRTGKPQGIAMEMADALIRILDWFESAQLDVEAIVLEKHRYNETRPYRHGGKAL